MSHIVCSLQCTPIRIFTLNEHFINSYSFSYEGIVWFCCFFKSKTKVIWLSSNSFALTHFSICLIKFDSSMSNAYKSLHLRVVKYIVFVHFLNHEIQNERLFFHFTDFIRTFFVFSDFYWAYNFLMVCNLISANFVADHLFNSFLFYAKRLFPTEEVMNKQHRKTLYKR